MKNYKLDPFLTNTTTDYENNLNAQQLKVVKEADGPSLVLAGAGSGKTRVLIYRLAYLLETGASPKDILLMTFTNRAAYEMINRSEVLLKSTLSQLWAGTFHHIGNITLRREGHILGYDSNFTIIDREDAKDILEDCLDDLGLYKKEKTFPKKGIIYNIYSLAASSQNTIEEAIQRFSPQVKEYTYTINSIISLYKKKKVKANVMDFSDLLTNWLKVLQNPDVCEKYSKTFKHILVDEYQDTNKLQFKILKKLSSYHNNIIAVGDDAQSIYSFRAADIKNILDFPKTFHGTKIFKLQTNYRSTPEILSMANEIIKHNLNQFPKDLNSIRPSGKIPCVVKTKDVYEQAKFIGQRILELNRNGIPLKEMAVLFRSRFQALELEMELLKRNIPYVVRGGLRFFEQAHIKDTMAFLKVIINPKDEVSFKRAISLQKGIGRGFAHKIWQKFGNEKKSLNEIEKSLSKRQKEGFKNFSSLFEKLQKTKNPTDALREILTTYKDYCYLSFDNADERIMDLEELAKMASNYANIKDFLLDLSSFEDFKGESKTKNQDEDDTFVLSTIHQAKGLEWEVVFIIGFSDYDFPHPKALKDSHSLEEERRLFYVATTRTKSLLHITYPNIKYTFKNGAVLTRASMFLDELSPNTYENWDIQA